MSKNAIFICGPTAVGKTGVAIELAKWLNTEIISFDSRQFYRELKIGAAPPSPEELKSVKHHFIGHLSVSEDFSAGDFETETLKLLKNLFESHDHVILVGGSGLYLKALTEGFDEMPQIPEEIREDLNLQFQREGLEPLQKELSEKDPGYYRKVDQHNPQRIIRALEVIRSTGRPYTDFRKGTKAHRDFNIVKIGLNLPRPQLYKRINQRVDQMLKAGLEEEVRSLLPYRHKNALQTVGYREFLRYFDGEISHEEAAEEIKKNSRRYAKRQLTWFRRDADIKWFEPQEIEEMKEFVVCTL